MSFSSNEASAESSANSVYAAIARTATRSLALYFSRPVRLFKPSKVSGWNSLRGIAAKDGVSLTPQYLSQLVKSHGFILIPKHFFPPMVINAALGIVLWETYAETSSLLKPHLESHPTLMAGMSGAVAGGTQALIAAPAENLRIVLEGGTGRGWSHAWKEVFRVTEHNQLDTRNKQEIRQVRNWVKEVKGMAGRGWDGWGWGFSRIYLVRGDRKEGSEILTLLYPTPQGFAIFFSIFDVTRRVAANTKSASQNILQNSTPIRDDSFRRHFPRTVHGLTLIAGGVSAGLAYEIACRPWDAARRAVQIRSAQDGALTILSKEVREQGFRFLFANTSISTKDTATTTLSRRVNGGLRTLARVGPWGIGFLFWEAFGPGLS